MSLRRRLLALVPLALLLFAGGCKVNTINYFPPHPASVRVINLLPEAAAIDVQIDGATAFTGVTFQSLTGYQTYDNKTTNFSINVTGSTTPLISFGFPLAGEQPYTIVVFGTLSNPSATLLAEVANAPTNGNIQLALFNAAINNAAFDVYVTAPGADISTVGPNFNFVSYNGVSLNLAFAPGTYQVRITQQGTKTVIYDSGGTALTPNIALTMIAYSKGSGVLVNAVVLESRGGSTPLDSVFARTKAVNAAPVIGPVNQTMGTTFQVVTNLPYANASSYNQVSQGPTQLDFEASATPGAVIASVPTTLAPGTDATVFVTGLPGAQQAFVLQDSNLPPFGGNVRLRFVNTAWDANPVNVAMNGTTIASNVAYPTASAYVETATATVTFTFTDAVTGTVLLSLPDVVLVSGQTSTVYLLGPAAAAGGFVTQDN
ncbi:MAG: DUF4397 domain-containing protein [Betaproteobacteria bacterium]|nr:DUF4397 domain-containing protein [Betaproteobacteria bacterium]